MMTERPAFKCKECGKILRTSRGVIRRGCSKDMDIHQIYLSSHRLLYGF
jgi:hypothetical protein